MVNKLIQGNDLAYMRQETRQAMPDLVDIQRKSLVSDKQGGYTETWANAYQNIAGRIASNGGSETLENNRRDPQLDFTLTVAYDQSVDSADRVVHSSGTYEVQTVDTGKSWATTKRCKMRQL
jgi:SPP1 family predicted phage head-tail adaptor